MKKNPLKLVLNKTLWSTIIFFGITACSSSANKEGATPQADITEKNIGNTTAAPQTSGNTATPSNSPNVANQSGNTTNSSPSNTNNQPAKPNQTPPANTPPANNTTKPTDLGASWRKQPLGKVEYVTQVDNNVLWAARNALHIPGQYPRNDNTMGNVYAIDKSGNGKQSRGIISPFSNHSESADRTVDYVALSQDGKPFIGEHNGQIRNAVLWQYTGEFQNNLPVLKQREYDVNVKFINQAYSTYAALYTDALNDQLLTYVHSSKYDRNIMDKYNKLDSKLRGDATYKGNVIGSQQKAGETHYSLPQVDGTVELKARFGETSGSISGVINSNSIGQIRLNESAVNYVLGDTNFQGGNAAAGSMKGFYSGSVVGPELNEVVGKVRITNDAGAGYQAVFGAAKQ